MNAQIDQSAPVLRVIPQMHDANPRGDIFGGWLMAQLDLAGMLIGARKIHASFATIAVKDMIFKQPIFAFDEVSIYGEISAIGKTSFTVEVAAYVRRSKDYNAEPLFVSTAHIVYALIKTPGEKENAIIKI